jgi:hypothetical protein|tara:strand:- start:6511 stop:6924 length:414 start_codon:yes stop_codon:yes gene_type:complete
MKLLLSKSHVEESVWYNTIIDQETPKDLPLDKLVFSGTLKEMKEFFGVSNIVNPTKTAISFLVANDGSHVTKLFEKRDKVPAALRQHSALSFPVMYRDYTEEGAYPFSNDPVSSIDSAWEKIGSPDTFSIYVVLMGA